MIDRDIHLTKIMTMPKRSDSFFSEYLSGSGEPLGCCGILIEWIFRLQLCSYLYYVQGLCYESRDHARYATGDEFLICRHWVIFLVAHHLYICIVFGGREQALYLVCSVGSWLPLIIRTILNHDQVNKYLSLSDDSCQDFGNTHVTFWQIVNGGD